MQPVVLMLVEIAGILLLGALGEFIFSRTRVPDVVWLVGAGILAGPISGLTPAGLLKPGIPFFGAIALTVILSSGAFRLRLSEVAAAAPRGIFLGLSGFVFSLIAIYGFFWLSTEMGYVRPSRPLAWLMAGAILAGTSVDRSPEEKWQIVQEGIKSGNVSLTCLRHGIAPDLLYRWKGKASPRANSRMI